MNFKFKNMPQYIRNAVEPINRALQLWMQANHTEIRNTMSSGFTDIKNALEETNTTIENFKNTVKSTYMPIAGGSFSGSVNETWLNLGTGAQMDLSKANFFYKNCASGSLAFSFKNIPAAPKAMTVSLCLDNCSGRSMSWPSVIWNGGSAPSFSANSIVTFFILGGSRTYAWHSFSQA